MRTNLSNNLDQEVDTSMMRSKLPNNVFLEFDVMIVSVANKSIMKLKFPNNDFFEFRSTDRTCNKQIDHEIEIANNFNLLINLLVTRTLMRSKLPNNVLF